MKGILYKSKDGWMVKYTTHKTIPGIKGVMGSHSRLPESNYIPVHPDNALGLFIQDTDIKNEGLVVDFEIVEVIVPVEDGTTMYKCAKLVNEEKHFKSNKQKKFTNIMEHNNIKRMYTEEDMKKELYEFGKLVLDTFHSEGRTHSGKDRLSRIKFDEWFNLLNKQDNEK